MVWVSALSSTGKFSDIRIFRSALKRPLESRDFCVADNSYADGKFLQLLRDKHNVHDILTLICARFENLNS